MAQNPNQQRASDAVARWLSANFRNIAWLADQSGIDPGTVGDFLKGKRWPQYGTMGKIEKAIGWPEGSIRDIANGANPDEIGAGVGGNSYGSEYVAAPGPRAPEGVITNEELYRILLRMRADNDQIHARLDGLSGRLENLEQRGA